MMIEMTLPGELSTVADMCVIDNGGTIEGYVINSFTNGTAYRNC